SAPTLPTIPAQTVTQLALLTGAQTCPLPNLPANTLTYQFLAAPTNASINASGIITWTPTEAQGPANNVVFTTKVTDNGTPALSRSEERRVGKEEVNRAPSLPTIHGTREKELT